MRLNVNKVQRMHILHQHALFTCQKSVSMHCDIYKFFTQKQVVTRGVSGVEIQMQL